MVPFTLQIYLVSEPSAYKHSLLQKAKNICWAGCQGGGGMEILNRGSDFFKKKIPLLPNMVSFNHVYTYIFSKINDIKGIHSNVLCLSAAISGHQNRQCQIIFLAAPKRLPYPGCGIPVPPPPLAPARCTSCLFIAPLSCTTSGEERIMWKLFQRAQNVLVVVALSKVRGEADRLAAQLVIKIWLMTFRF